MEEGRPTVLKVGIFKLVSSILLITTVCLLSSFNYPNTTLTANGPSKALLAKKDSISYLALGDSYTIGESVAPEMRWPVLLANSLNENKVPTKNPKIIAKTGWRTDELIRAVLVAEKEEKIESKYDMVSILIGVNNQYQGKDIETYKSELVALVSLAEAHSKRGLEGVFAFSIPDYGVTPFGAEKEEKISKEIEEWNRAFKEIMDQLGIPFYDITPISKEAKNDPSLIAEDKLHPSGKMYKLWVEKYTESILKDVLALDKG